MKKDVYVCNNCGHHTMDIYEKGWMTFAPTAFTVSRGRDKKGCGKTIFRDQHEATHFCKPECFLQWLYDPSNIRVMSLVIDLEDADE